MEEQFHDGKTEDERNEESEEEKSESDTEDEEEEETVEIDWTKKEAVDVVVVATEIS